MPSKNERQGRSSNIFFFTTVYCRDTVFHQRLDGMVDWRCGNRFLLLTEWALAILISVTKGGHMSKPTDLVQGTLDLLILKILALEPLHGWAIGQRLKQVSGDVLQVSDGSLYPALHKLEQEGWIKAEWKPSENNRRAKFYSLTRLGRKELEKEAANWDRLSTAITRVVKLKEA
jgi:PadR family transcriptional regulator